MCESAPVWETSKENVLPLKRGRSAKGLADTLGADKKKKSSDYLSEEKSFENSLILASDNVKKLEIYVGYFKWTRNTFVSNSEKALKLLERCTCDLKDEEVLKNDLRFVKMWIEYVSACQRSSSFRFM